MRSVCRQPNGMGSRRNCLRLPIPTPSSFAEAGDPYRQHSTRHPQLSRNGIRPARPSPVEMGSAVVFDRLVTFEPSMTRCQLLALKGPHVTAQGEALGGAIRHRMSPDRAKSGSVQRADLAGRKLPRAVPPFQGGNRVGVGFPGLRPGKSHSAPSGPAVERVLNYMSSRFRGDDESRTAKCGVTARV